jgi:hypothetical protein
VTGSPPPQQPVQHRRARYHTQVAQDVQDRARAAVRGVSAATGTDYTLAGLTEDALERYCEHLEQAYNKGKRWPVPQVRLRPGRRLPTPDPEAPE